MYEPIGFAGYDNRAHIPPEYPYNDISASNGEDTDKLPDKPDDKTAIRLLSALIACCLLVSVIGIDATFALVYSFNICSKEGNTTLLIRLLLLFLVISIYSESVFPFTLNI